LFSEDENLYLWFYFQIFLISCHRIEDEKVRVENEKQKEAIEQAKIARQVTAKYLQTTLRE
jgi:hypothetical protein